MMRRPILCFTLLSFALCASASYAKPKRRVVHAAPVTPSGVSTPPALSEEPEPVTLPAGAAPTAATPAPAPTPTPEPPPVKTKSTVELDSLVAEYSAIRDELFRSRAKAAVLGEALLKTQLVVTFRYEAGRAWPLKKVTLRLDERPVFAGESVNGTEPIKVLETVAAPGRHVLTTRVEASGTGEDRISYATEDTFGFDLADGKLTRVEITVDETGSGAAPFVKRKEGSFDVRIKANVKSLELAKK